MAIKTRKSTVVFFTLALLISNMGSDIYSFAQGNETTENIATIKNMDTEDCRPDKVTDLRVALKNSTSIKLEWKRVRKADGYIICRANARNGIYKKIADTCDKTPGYLDENLESGENYYYKVRAYTKVEDKRCCGCFSDILEATTCPAIVEDLHMTKRSNCEIIIEWGRVCRASGYEVYRTTSSTGSYTKVATITDGSRTFYIDKNVKRDKRYFYKVRAFKEVNGQPCFGDCSKVLSTCTKK